MIKNGKTDGFTNPGSRYRPVYTPKVMDDGVIDLVQTGVEDMRPLLNSYKDEADPNFIMARVAGGDLSVLNRGNPAYLDVVDAPKSLADAYDTLIRAEASFAGLPSEVKSKFDNSFYKFIVGAGSDEWWSKLGVEPKSNEVKETGVDEK